MTASGYTRQSASQIVTGSTIQASDFNNEYNQIQSAFDGTSGHDHSAGAGLGQRIVLTTSVQGILPVANGGTNSAYFGITGPTTARTYTVPDASDTITTIAATQTLTNKTLTSPILVTPALGVATVTSLNGLTITSSTGTLTITNLKTLAVSNSITLAGTDSTTITFQGTDTYVGRNTTDTLTNKTLTSPVISSISNSGTVTIPTGTDTLVGKATTDTLTNKTYDTAGTGNVFKINGTQISANTGSGSNVLATSPTLVTPTLGVATASSLAVTSSSAPANGLYLLASNAPAIAANSATALRATYYSGSGTPVNYVSVSNAGTGFASFIESIGSDTNVGLGILAQGTGAISLQTNGPAQSFAAATQFRVTHTASAVNNIAITGGAAGSPGIASISAEGSSTNISINVVPKGSGVFSVGSDTVATLTASQTLTNKTIAGGSNTISGITETMLSTSDITTLNVSTSKHGFAPKLPNDATKYLDGTGAYSVPATAGANSQSTPGDQTGTTSATAVMLGLAGSITPTGSGKVLIIISGDMRGTAGSAVIKAQISYGTSTAPTNGAALTGTQVGSNVNFAASTETNEPSPFSCNAIVTGLTPSTAYWLDLAFSTTSGTGTIKNVSISTIEL